jgi:hypothetical protein
MPLLLSVSQADWNSGPMMALATSWSQLIASSEGGFIGLLPCTKLYKNAEIAAVSAVLAC